jgi:hypothetical protein
MKTTKLNIAIALILGGAMATSVGFAKGKPTVEAGNNLSLPVVFTGDATVSGTQLAYSLTGSCLLVQPESDPYPYACVQKDPLNTWLANYYVNAGQVKASHVNVGDNLESRPQRTTQTIRVEFTPYTNDLVGNADEVNTFLAGAKGVAMWYVSGSGTTEVWGAQSNLASSGQANIYQPISLYGSNLASIHTSVAKLNITKINSQTAQNPPPTVTWTWNSLTSKWIGATTDVQPIYNSAISAEINVAGKNTYGYNWNPKKDTPPSGPGWYRLTYYTGGNTIDILDSTELVDPTAAVAAAAEGTYTTPGKSATNDVVFIDIYLEGSATGGGGGPRR